MAMMLPVNVGAGALLLPFRLSVFFAALATLGVLGTMLLGARGTARTANMLEYGLYGASLFRVRLRCVSFSASTSANPKRSRNSAASTWPISRRSTN